MKKIAAQVIFWFGLLSCTSNRVIEESLQSPSGKFITQVFVGDDGGSKHGLIFLLLLSSNGHELDVVNTGASIFQNYAVYWDSENTIVLYSSDIGILSWIVSDDKLIATLPDYEMSNRAKAFFNRKMGR